MQWFREIGWKDQDAVLQFPTSLTKEQRKLVHETAQSFGLGTSSSGFKETVGYFAYFYTNLFRGWLHGGRNILAPRRSKKADHPSAIVTFLYSVYMQKVVLFPSTRIFLKLKILGPSGMDLG